MGSQDSKGKKDKTEEERKKLIQEIEQELKELDALKKQLSTLQTKVLIWGASLQSELEES